MCERTTYIYDTAGRVVVVVDAQGNRTRYAYDDAGRRIETTDPEDGCPRFGDDAPSEGWACPEDEQAATGPDTEADAGPGG